MIAFPEDILHVFMHRSFNDAMEVFFKTPDISWGKFNVH